MHHLASLALLGISAIWGLTFAVMKAAFEAIPPLWFISLRFFIAAGVMVAVLIAKSSVRKAIALTKKNPPLRGSKKQKFLTAKTGFFMGFTLFLGFASQTLGLERTSASNAGFITGLCVVFVPLIEFFWSRKKLKPSVVIGTLFSILGLALLSLSDRLEFYPGDPIVLLCALIFAVQIHLVSRIPGEVHLEWMIVIQFLSCSMLALIGAFYFHPNHAWAKVLESLTLKPVYLGLGFCSLFATVLALWAQVRLQSKIGTSRAALIFSIEPVFSAIFSYFLLSEILTTRQLWGCGLLFLAILISEGVLSIKPKSSAAGTPKKFP